MALSERVDRLANRILQGEFQPLIWIDQAEKIHASTVEWREEAKKTGIKVSVAEKIVHAVMRGLEDEDHVRLYFLNERNRGEKDDWVVLVTVQDPDGAIFVGITPGILAEVKSAIGLAEYVRDMVASTRPSGRPFGAQPSLN